MKNKIELITAILQLMTAIILLIIALRSLKKSGHLKRWSPLLLYLIITHWLNEMKTLINLAALLITIITLVIVIQKVGI